YGEGPHSDHAALTIRSLGGRAVIAQSIDPMHELTLKKQGILALTFAWPENGDKVKEDDLIDVLGVHELAVGKPLELLLKHADGTTERLKLDHSYTEDQIGWFKAGSFLGYISHA
ncbi:MAG: aconitate hydratase, partial [Parachlamydiaceae bacterium]|nr:aconitate hydratase [Parachlamydiaceae bacterium]